MSLETITGALADLEAMDVGEEIVSEQAKREAAEAEWMAMRAGKFTCSQFAKLMQQAGRKKEDRLTTFSQQGWSYIYEVAAERLGGERPSYRNSATEHGHLHEATAVAFYAQVYQADVDYNSQRFVEVSQYVGGSPDALVGDDGVLEVKCPYNSGVHLKTVHGGKIPREHLWQLHGHLLVTGRKWCDFLSYDPRLSAKNCFVRRIHRDEVMLNDLSTKLALAVFTLKEIMEAE